MSPYSKILGLAFFTLFGVCAVNSVQAQLFANHFNCGKDKLDATTVRFSPHPQSLVLGQRCEVSVYDRKGKKITDNDFALICTYDHVKHNDLTFFVDQKAKGEPWPYVDGRLMVIEGAITIMVTRKCTDMLMFPFMVRQAYDFDHEIKCKGERREFAVARYKNAANKNLFAVLDLAKNQLYLLEAPITIDASGVKGRDGVPGTVGKRGADGMVNSQNGGPGSSGGDGGDGGPGGDGGEITVYLSQNIQSISVNVAGGAGGAGGRGGKGGPGGTGYSRKVEKVNAKGKTYTEYEKLGKDGAEGSDGRAGNEGVRGKEGRYNIIPEYNIKKYFDNINHPYFKVGEIDE